MREPPRPDCREARPHVLTVRLFGDDLTAFHDDRELALDPSCRMILAFMLLHRDRYFTRQSLAELAVPASGNAPVTIADVNLQLRKLRAVLEPEPALRGTYIAVSLGGEVGINPHATCWMDTVEFELCAEALLAKPIDMLSLDDIEAAEATTKLHATDLLRGYDAAWAVAERDRLRLLCLDLLTHALVYTCRHDLRRVGLHFATRIVAMDPCREDVHFEIMRMYVQTGQAPLAIRQFEHCRSTLAARLGVQPMVEMQALYDVLARGEPPAPKTLESVILRAQGPMAAPRPAVTA